MVSGRVLHYSIDHAATEAGDHRHAAGHCGGFELADFLHPSHISFDVGVLQRQWCQVVGAAPGEKQS
jgi:hypothetical protein